jgi:hypothetical protein
MAPASIFGYPREGFHAPSLRDFAALDLILTATVALWISSKRSSSSRLENLCMTARSGFMHASGFWSEDVSTQSSYSSDEQKPLKATVCQESTFGAHPKHTCKP